MNWLNTIIGFIEDIIWDIKFKIWDLCDKIEFKKQDCHKEIEFDEIEVKPKKKKSKKKSKKKA